MTVERCPRCATFASPGATRCGACFHELAVPATPGAVAGAVDPLTAPLAAVQASYAPAQPSAQLPAQPPALPPVPAPPAFPPPAPAVHTAPAVHIAPAAHLAPEPLNGPVDPTFVAGDLPAWSMPAPAPVPASAATADADLVDAEPSFGVVQPFENPSYDESPRTPRPLPDLEWAVVAAAPAAVDSAPAVVEAVDPLTAPIAAVVAPPAPRRPGPRADDGQREEAAPHGEAGSQERRATWPCLRCGGVNEVDLDSCAQCGAGFLAGIEGFEMQLPGIGSVTRLDRSHKVGLALAVGVGVILVFMVVATLLGMLL